MQKLINQIKFLQNSEINNLVDSRLREFESFKNKSNSSWFSELCFCILAANSKQKTSENIQKKLGKKLMTMPQEELSDFIKLNKHRFHNNKSKYIVEARKYHKIRDIINKQSNKRDWLVHNVKGIGFKEASHFLRNTGSKNLAILDRHIINLMTEHNILEKPKSLTNNQYILIEKKFIKLADKLKVSPAKLDLLMWYLKTGEVLK